MEYTVGEVARLAGVSVRTLHHYDEIGLLSPSGHSEAGWRLYADADLDALQQILLYRELDMDLASIAKALADPRHDRLTALVEQRAQIADRIGRAQRLLDLVDKTIDATRGGIAMTKEEMFEVFGEFDPSQYDEEVEQRWGDTEAYRESARRTKRYTKDDWARFKAEQEAQGAEMLALYDAGVACDDPRAMDVAEAARLQIDQWFYPCSRQMHLALGDMYIADPRFTAHYEKMRTGLAQWYRDAIAANARRP